MDPVLKLEAGVKLAAVRWVQGGTVKFSLVRTVRSYFVRTTY